MKITIIGGGNMGGAIAIGLAQSSTISARDITVVNRSQKTTDSLKSIRLGLNVLTGIYDSLSTADIVILALKPWLIQEFLELHKELFCKPKQIIASVASGITLSQLAQWLPSNKILFRVMPNTAIAVKQSMTFITSKNAVKEQIELISDLFLQLGKVEVIEEKAFAAAASLASCGIAFAFRYIRAAMEGGIEMGLYSDQSKNAILQTLRGAVDLLEANGSHPEVEIDKVTTPGGITIKGLNKMEQSGFTTAVIEGLKASNVG